MVNGNTASLKDKFQFFLSFMALQLLHGPGLPQKTPLPSEHNSILLSLRCAMRPSERRPPILFLTFPLVFY